MQKKQIYSRFRKKLELSIEPQFSRQKYFMKIRNKNVRSDKSDTENKLCKKERFLKIQEEVKVII